MIDNLISGREFSPFVVIKDTLAAPGDNLLFCWTQELRKRFSTIVALHCGMTKHSHGTFDIDCLAGMECDVDPPPLTSVLASIEAHPHFPDASSSSSSICFVLPDLNSLFLFFPPSSVFSFLDGLLRLHSSSFLLCLLHRDCLPAPLLPSLDYLLRTSITLHPSSTLSSSSSSPQMSFIADVFHKKPSGKVTRGRFLTHLCSSPLRIVACTDVAKLDVKDDFEVDPSTTDVETTTTAAAIKTTSNKTSPQIAYESSSSSDDPTANLTFNLSLTDKEKSAREKVVLPFSNKKRPGQGKIIYEAEDEDDFDEEDPDDDLNI